MPLCLCSLLAAISQFWVSIGQKIQLTGYENANSMRNAKCVDTQNSMEWPYCSFLYCGYDTVEVENGLITFPLAGHIWNCAREWYFDEGFSKNEVNI